MGATVLSTLVAVVFLYLAHSGWQLWLNIRKAKRSGLTYIVVPIFPYNQLWLLTLRLWVPLMYKVMPYNLVSTWLEVLNVEWSWYNPFGVFERLKSDSFLAVAPGGCILFVADAKAVHDITRRRNDFSKPVKLYRILDIYGKHVVSTEGADWRRHRKISSGPFDERNNFLVWKEALNQAQCMLASWLKPRDDGKKTIQDIQPDVMRLALHVISRAGFNIRCLWPGTDDAAEGLGRATTMSTNTIPEGHTMSYNRSMTMVLQRSLSIALIPNILLRFSPIRYLREAHEAYVEWGKYMEEMYDKKSAKLISDETGPSESGMDLMEALIKGSGLLPGLSDGPRKQGPGLTKSEVMGNAFIFMIAGHETTAATIHYAFLYLAMNISSQRDLQRSLDDLLADRPVDEWDYEKDFPRLFGSMVGAVMNETLRVAPPVPAIPKVALKDQPLHISGKDCIVPEGTTVSLLCASTQRNPRYWPSGPPSNPACPENPYSNTTNDLEEFKPKRWIPKGANSRPNGRPLAGSPDGEPGLGLAHSIADRTAETQELGVNTQADISSALYSPPEGAFIAFSQGWRACLGRRFSQVETVAVLATIFSKYSVELAVDEWATDEEVDGMSEEERKVVWGKARTKAKRLLGEAYTIITLQIRNGSVPLRLVRRGSEQFDFKAVE